MPRGLILKLDSLCNRQSEIQFYYIPIHKSTCFFILPNGDYLTVSGDALVRITPEGKEVWYNENGHYASGYGGMVGEKFLFLVGDANDTTGRHERTVLALLDESGSMGVIKSLQNWRGSTKHISRYADSSVVYALTIPGNPITGDQKHLQITSFVIKDWSVKETLENNTKFIKRDSLFYGGYELYPARTVDIAEQPTQLLGQKIKLNIKKHPKTKP